MTTANCKRENRTALFQAVRLPKSRLVPGIRPEIAPTRDAKPDPGRSAVYPAARRQLARQCYRMVRKSLTKDEFGFFSDFFHHSEKTALKAHSEHNLSGIKHAFQGLCEAVLKLCHPGSLLLKNAALHHTIQRVARALPEVVRGRNTVKRIPEVDFFCGILTLLFNGKKRDDWR